MTNTTEAERQERADRARLLLNDNLLAEALTQIRMAALLALAEADAADTREIHRQQAIVHVTGELVATLEAYITATGAHDGGVSMEIPR